MSKVAIIGTGSWGTALGLLLADNGHEVCMWSAIADEIKELKENNRHKTLPDVILPKTITYTTDLEEAMKDRQLLVLSVPSIYTRNTARAMKSFYKKGQVIVNVAKGIEETTLLTLAEQIKEEIDNVEIAVLSGPSHAEEVAKRLPTTCVVGALKKNTADFVQNIFMSPVFRVYTSPDILGIELGGSLKNVIALAAGIADGLGYGDNAKAALITRGIAEMARLGVKMGGNIQSFYGLSGMGDLIVTCASMHSRNRRAGIYIGQGYSMKEAMQKVEMVVEGVYSAKAAKALSEKFDIDMPIVSEVNAILFDNKDAKLAVDTLMQREKNIENKDLVW